MKSNKTVGRPLATYKVPNKLRFTFKDLVKANSHVTPLAIRNFMARDASEGDASRMILTKETVKTSAKGRESTVYINRIVRDAAVKGAKTKAAKVAIALSDVNAPVAEPVAA